MSRSARALVALLVLAGCSSSAVGSAGPVSVPPSTTPASPVGPSPSASASPSPSAAASPSGASAPSATPMALFGPMPTGPLDAATAGRLQHVLDDLVGVANPDAIAAVVTADGTWAGAAGVDGPKGRLAQATDEFGIASVSKTILATLILRLEEQGKIDLDAPLASYLEGIDVDANDATVRQALAMRSGLGDTVAGAIDQALAQCDHAWTRDEVLTTIPEPFATPGDTYHYSNPTYKLVGYAAEHAAGMPLAAALHELVLDPVEGDRILLQGQGTMTPKPWALPVDGFNGPLDVARYGTGGSLPCLGFSTLSLAASAMASDAPSLARWGWALFSGKIVDATSLAAMTTVDSGGHGLGIDRITDLGSVLAYGHAGSQAGYAAQLTILPEMQAVVVMFINRERADPLAGTSSLIRAIQG